MGVVALVAGLQSCWSGRKSYHSRNDTHPTIVTPFHSGVSKIRLVDFDFVTLSSLNRHATATLADVGTPKVKCIEKTLKQIAKWAEIDSRIEIWRKEEGGLLLEGADWVVGEITAAGTNLVLY